MQRPAPSAAPIMLHAFARDLGIEVPAGPDVEITGVATIEEAGPSEITFLANEKYVSRLAACRAAAVLIGDDFHVEAPIPQLRTKRPRLAFARLLEHFRPTLRPGPGIHPTAIVPPSCSLGADVHLGAYVVLGEDVHLGDRVVIHAHVAIYDDVRIGAGSEIHSHVSIRDGTRIGRNVIIHNGTVIGADGFGFEPDENGRLAKVPQVGTVEICDDVEIQANAAVDRSMIGVTRIGRGTKLDNFAQVAHGCTIGEDTIVCGQVGLAGSTHVGNRVMLGGQCGFSGHTSVADGAKVAAQSGVMRDLKAGKTYAGSPAFELHEMMRTAGLLPKLPDLYKRIRRLEKALEKLAPEV